MDEQKILLKIVKTWKITLTPEYRGFRCADCQRYLHKAFHHQLNYGGFNTPVHFCKNCHKKSNLADVILRSLTCDNCARNMFKAYHIWAKKGKNMIETHYCKECLLNSAEFH